MKSEEQENLKVVISLLFCLFSCNHFQKVLNVSSKSTIRLLKEKKTLLLFILKANRSNVNRVSSFHSNHCEWFQSSKSFQTLINQAWSVFKHQNKLIYENASLGIQNQLFMLCALSQYKSWFLTWCIHSQGL